MKKYIQNDIYKNFVKRKRKHLHSICFFIKLQVWSQLFYQKQSHMCFPDETRDTILEILSLQILSMFACRQRYLNLPFIKTRWKMIFFANYPQIKNEFFLEQVPGGPLFSIEFLLIVFFHKMLLAFTSIQSWTDFLYS